jgi:hypothetical protein
VWALRPLSRFGSRRDVGLECHDDGSRRVWGPEKCVFRRRGHIWVDAIRAMRSLGGLGIPRLSAQCEYGIRAITRGLEAAHRVCLFGENVKFEPIKPKIDRCAVPGVGEWFFTLFCSFRKFVSNSTRRMRYSSAGRSKRTKSNDRSRRGTSQEPFHEVLAP